LRMILAVVASVCLARAACAEEPSALPAADALLRDVRDRLPREELRIAGDLEVRGRKGVVIGRMNVEALIALGGDQPRARYTVRDALGGEIEELTVSRPAQGGAPQLAYRRGDPPAPAAAPGIHEAIGNSDLTWADLALAFLDWEGGRTVGRETYKGQECFLVDLPPPAEAASDGPGRPYARMRLWIHEALRMVAKLEAYDAEERLVRRMEIKALRRVNGRWMIKDMEVEGFPAVHKTRFRVRDVGGEFTYDGDGDD